MSGSISGAEPPFTALLAAARSASTAGDPAAAGLWSRVTAANPHRGDFWAALAEAAMDAGDFGTARSAFLDVHALGVHDPDDDLAFRGEARYRMAQCEAALGDTGAALATLAAAVGEGLRDPAKALTDPWFAALRDSSEFHAALDRPAAVDRPAAGGWRQDIAHLVATAARRSPIWHRVASAVEAEAAALSARVAELTDMQVLAGLLRVLRHLEDGHAFLVLASDHLDDSTWRPTLPVAFSAYSDGLAITATSPAHARLLGARILAFAGHSPEALFAELDPYISRDNPQWLTTAVPQRLRRLPLLHAIGLTPAPDRVRLTVELPDGTVTDVELPADPDAPTRWTAIGRRPEGWSWLPATADRDKPAPVTLLDTAAIVAAGVPVASDLPVPDAPVSASPARTSPASTVPIPDRPYWFTPLPAAPHPLYFRFTSIAAAPDDPFPDHLARLRAHLHTHGTRHLIIDLRWNTGGDTLLGEQLLHAVLATPAVNRPGGLYVLIGRDTFSAAQNTATLLERHTSAVFVGEPTGSSPTFVGETIPFTLPYSGVEVNVSDLRWQTSYPFDRRPWIAPTLYAPPTLAAYLANRDPAVEAVLAAIEGDRT